MCGIVDIYASCARNDIPESNPVIAPPERNVIIRVCVCVHGVRWFISWIISNKYNRLLTVIGGETVDACCDIYIHMCVCVCIIARLGSHRLHRRKLYCIVIIYNIIYIYICDRDVINGDRYTRTRDMKLYIVWHHAYIYILYDIVSNILLWYDIACRRSSFKSRRFLPFISHPSRIRPIKLYIPSSLHYNIFLVKSTTYNSIIAMIV